MQKVPLRKLKPILIDIEEAFKTVGYSMFMYY